MLGTSRIRNIRELRRVTPVERLGQLMARTILVARKPETPSVRPYPLQEIKETPFAGPREALQK